MLFKGWILEGPSVNAGLLQQVHALTGFCCLCFLWFYSRTKTGAGKSFPHLQVICCGHGGDPSHFPAAHELAQPGVTSSISEPSSQHRLSPLKNLSSLRKEKGGTSGDLLCARSCFDPAARGSACVALPWGRALALCRHRW